MRNELDFPIVSKIIFAIKEFIENTCTQNYDNLANSHYNY